MPKGNYPMDFYPEKSAYVGGEKRITMEEAEQFGIGIAFETCGWSDQSKSHLYFILEWLYGEATGFSVGGPGRGMHARSHYTLVNGRLVEETERIFMPFADTGLFGLVFIMPGELFGKEINQLNLAMTEIARLGYDITEEEFQRAKNCQSTKTGFNLERQLERIDEGSRNQIVIVLFKFFFQYFGQLKHPDYLKWIQTATREDLITEIRRMLKGKMSLVMMGPDVDKLPKFSDTEAVFKNLIAYLDKSHP